MNPLVLYMASGESLYPGAGLLLVVIAATPWLAGRWLQLVRQVLVWSAVALMVMACAPFAWWLDSLFFAALIAWLVSRGKLERLGAEGRRKFRLAAGVLLAALTVLLPALEMPWRMRPRFTGARADHLVVMGDSISAGISK